MNSSKNTRRTLVALVALLVCSFLVSSCSRRSGEYVSEIPPGLRGEWTSNGGDFKLRINHEKIVATEHWRKEKRVRKYRAEKIWINEDRSKLIIMCDKSSSENDPMNTFPAAADYQKKLTLVFNERSYPGGQLITDPNLWAIEVIETFVEEGAWNTRPGTDRQRTPQVTESSLGVFLHTARVYLRPETSQFSELVRSFFVNPVTDALFPWISWFAWLLPLHFIFCTPYFLVKALVATAKKKEKRELLLYWLAFLVYCSITALFYSFSDFPDYLNN